MSYYTNLERGLNLRVTNREEFVEYIKDNVHDPGAQMENWGSDMAPVRLLIVEFYEEEEPDESYYKTYDIHKNNTASSNYWSSVLLEDMIEKDLLVEAGHDLERVEKENN